MTDSREKRAHFLFLWLRQGIVAQRGIKGLFKAVKAVFKAVKKHAVALLRPEGCGQKWKAGKRRLQRTGMTAVEDISVLLEVSRQSILAYLKTLQGYADEKARRKRESAARRREYKTEKQRQYRAVSGIMAVTAETMRREHDLAALELSREIYH